MARYSQSLYMSNGCWMVLPSLFNRSSSPVKNLANFSALFFSLNLTKSYSFEYFALISCASISLFSCTILFSSSLLSLQFTLFITSSLLSISLSILCSLAILSLSISLTLLKSWPLCSPKMAQFEQISVRCWMQTIYSGFWWIRQIYY